MKCKSIRMACAAAALLLAACTNDELAEQGTALPYGEYPLEISAVTLDVESGSEPWSAKAPQTRVSENTDGMSSKFEWNGTEKIGVQLYADGEVATYTLNEDKTLSSDKTLYWKDTKPSTVTAWYPVYEGESGTVDLTDQSEKLAYVLKGSGTGTYQNEVSLSFSHALAKVRVKLDGSQAENVKNVQIKSYTSCTNTQGSVSTNGANEGWITMKPCTYNDTKCWEANVVPSAITKFKVNDKEGTLSDFTPKAGKINTLTIDVAKEVNIKDITEEYTVEGNVVLKGDDNEHTLKLTLKDGANLTLEKVKLKGKNEAGNVIEVLNGSATITFTGENEITTTFNESYNNSPTSCAIYVSGNNATLTIDGKSDANKLTVNAENTNKGVGICGANGGNIVIKGGTIIAKGGLAGAAIGANSLSNCGNITINGGNITATGGQSAAAIGASAMQEDKGHCDDITITGGTVKAEANSTGGLGGAGIGGGFNSICGNISISGGNVTAIGGTGNYGGAGIGSHTGICKNINITGGTVTATGANGTDGSGAGIGAGPFSECENIVIGSKATVTATAGGQADDIGDAYPHDTNGQCGTVNIENGAKVTATNGRIKGRK